MFLTAHRIRHGTSEAVHSFLYYHDQESWTVPPEPSESNCGTLQRKITTLPEGGNEVLSYLNITKPEAMSWRDVKRLIGKWIASGPMATKLPLPLPWKSDVFELCRFEFATNASLAKAWWLELKNLEDAIEQILREEQKMPGDAMTEPLLGRSQMRPIHPGEILAEEFLAHIPNMNPTRFADVIGMAHGDVKGIMAGRQPITTEVALRFARALGTTAEFWLNLQRSYELRNAELSDRLMKEIQQIVPLLPKNANINTTQT